MSIASSSPQFSQAQHALADGLLDAGCGYTANVPGAKSQELFELLGGKQIALNERIAYETCYGASLAGIRSVLTMKNVGLNACLDPHIHATLNGTHAGLVIVLYDDVEVTSSPERQDSRPLNDVFPCLWLEPNSIEMAYEMATHAHALSELGSMPVILRVTNQLHRYSGTYTRITKKIEPLGIARKRDHYISYWTKRTKIYQKNLEKIQKAASNAFPSVVETKHSTGIIVAGPCREEIDESDYKKYDLFEIKSYPVDEKKVIQFINQHEKNVVFEQGFPYISNKVKELVGAQEKHIHSHTGNIPDLSDMWETFDFTEKIFLGLKAINPSYVFGDEGQFTDETTKTVEGCLCMGASVGVVIGLAAAGVSYPFAVTGDVSFLHGGMQSLREALVQDVPFGVIVIDNGGAYSTGGQARGADVTDIPKGISLKTVSYHETTAQEFAALFADMREKNQLAILHVITTEEK